MDPNLMRRATSIIASALQQADPGRASAYRDAARAFSDEVASTGIDYESTLSVCPRRYILTADGAFTGMARAYSLTDLVAGTSPHPSVPTVASAAQAARSAGVTTAFSEPFVPDNTIRAVASSAHLKIRTLDPLTGPPAAGWPRGADYFRLMEANLGALNAALGCGA
jgi:zinc transport system substrate-binding protein